MVLEVNRCRKHCFLQWNQVIEKVEQSENLNSEINQASYGTWRNIQSFGDCMKNFTGLKIIIIKHHADAKISYAIDKDGCFLEEVLACTVFHSISKRLNIAPISEFKFSRCSFFSMTRYLCR